ncbi:MAG: Diphthamide biosynthesis protein 3, partial [Paramarteilia canceri]
MAQQGAQTTTSEQQTSTLRLQAQEEPNVSGLLSHGPVEFSEMIFDDSRGAYTFDCPCGDQFVLRMKGHKYALCDMCSLYIE